MRTPRPGPYVLPVRDIVHHPGEMREFEIDLTTADRMGEGLVSIAAEERLELDIRLESVHEGILVTGTADTRLSGVCGRCLVDMVEPVEVEFQELFTYPGAEAADFEVQDDHVDLETLVRDAIVLSLPFQPVCQPDCLGLDPNTGERLADNIGESERTPVDIRWAALQQYTSDPDGEARDRAEPDSEDTVTEKS